VGLVTGLTFVQLLVQFAFQRLLARQFGAAAEMDAYVAALALPIVVSAVLAGSLGYVLVPVFAEQREAGGERAAAAVTSQIGLYLLAISLAAAGIVAAAAHPISAAMCPGFSAQQLALTIGLLRILALLVVANSLVSFLNALHQCLRQFVLPVAAGIAGTLAALAYTWLMIQQQGIYAAAWGVVLGAAATAAILLPPWLDQLRMACAWRLAPSEAVRRCLVLLLPLLLGSLYWRLDPLLDRYLGSFLSKGSLAHLGYAWRLTGAVMLVGTSGLSIVAFPALAAHAASGRRADLCGEIAHAWRLLIVLLVPVTMGLGMFSEPVTRLLYQDGAFTAADTRAVAWLVVLYLGVVIGASAGDVASRVSYALHDTRTPVLIGLVAFTLGAALKFLLVSRYAAAGLVLGTSVFYLFNAIAQTAVLLPRLGRDMLAGTALCLLRSGACAAVACLAAMAVLQLASAWAVLPASAAGAAVYVACLWLLGDEFAGRFLQPFQRSKPS
jgi:putative peptidoglycan lipid II flippase